MREYRIVKRYNKYAIQYRGINIPFLRNMWFFVKVDYMNSEYNIMTFTSLSEAEEELREIKEEQKYCDDSWKPI